MNLKHFLIYWEKEGVNIYSIINVKVDEENFIKIQKINLINYRVSKVKRVQDFQIN